MEKAVDKAAELGVLRERLAEDLRQESRETVAITRRLLAHRTDNPPGDTRAIASEIAAIMADMHGVAVEIHPGAEHIANVVMRVKGGRPGRRLVFNGHLDTFPLGDRQGWSADPLGEERGGRLYGLGVSDMKGGLAAILFAMRRLAAHREQLSGELVATFAGDEETMGVLGTQWLLDNVPHARGDAMISADAGSPRVLRFGEKGMIWLRLTARGRSAHAAHVHRGDSAIDKLIAVIGQLQRLRDYPVDAPEVVLRAIEGASAASEALSGVGETEVLRHVTITFGTIGGGRLSNLIADEAWATADVRLPVGVSVAEMEAEIGRIVAGAPGVELEISRRYEPSWTDPGHEAIALLSANCRQVLELDPAVTMRVGASDARLYRAAGIPTVVCGLTPHNMGAADEYVDVEELAALGQIFALTAFDYLSAGMA
jgi:succinyl-diaminopimelate desuccinylase